MIRGIGALVAMAGCVSAGDSVADILARAVAAERANRGKAKDFLFREVIRYSEELPNGEMMVRRASTYEVTFVEGEPFHRLVAIDGRPLPEDMAREEDGRLEKVAEFRRKTPIEERRKKTIKAEGQRFRVDIRLVEKYHELSLKGEDIVNGRKAWILSTYPRVGTRHPRSRMEWTLSQHCQYWIDQETFHPLRLESTQLYDWDDVGKGSKTEITWTKVEGVYLVSRIRSVNLKARQKQAVRQETDQVYSNYRHFESQTVITFKEPGEGAGVPPQEP